MPEELARTVARDEPSCSNAIQIQSAVAIALELVAPLRAKNLAGLMLGRHFVRARSGPGAVVHLVVPPGEIKNRVPLEFELPPDMVRLIDLYVERYRPLLMTESSGCLFPARRGGAKAPAHLGAQVQRTIKRTTGLTLNIHAFRHLCAFLFLKANPGEYETVRLLLGHKSLTTTVRNYCGLEQSDAFRRYDMLLDRYRRSEELRRAG